VLDPFRDTEVASTTLLVLVAVPLGVLVLAAVFVFVRAWREVATARA
jgi:hypothetical protein